MGPICLTSTYSGNLKSIYTRKINVKPADKLHSKQSEAKWKMDKQT